MLDDLKQETEELYIQALNTIFNLSKWNMSMHYKKIMKRLIELFRKTDANSPHSIRISAIIVKFLATVPNIILETHSRALIEIYVKKLPSVDEQFITHYIYVS